MQRSVFPLVEPFKELSGLEAGEGRELWSALYYLMLQDSYNVKSSVLINSIPAWHCTAFGSLAFVELREGTYGQGRQLWVCLKGATEFCLIAPPGIVLCSNVGLSAGFPPESSLLLEGTDPAWCWVSSTFSLSSSAPQKAEAGLCLAHTRYSSGCGWCTAWDGWAGRTEPGGRWSRE